jgi:hypothetical protein
VRTRLVTGGAVSAVAGTEHLDELEAVGAAMDRRRAVECALERLDAGIG